jgi:hypothetical protein
MMEDFGDVENTVESVELALLVDGVIAVSRL